MDRRMNKSLLNFVIHDVPNNTSEDVVELYRRWRKKADVPFDRPCGISDPDDVVEVLNILGRAGSSDKVAIKNLLALNH